MNAAPSTRTSTFQTNTVASVLKRKSVIFETMEQAMSFSWDADAAKNSMKSANYASNYTGSNYASSNNTNGGGDESAGDENAGVNRQKKGDNYHYDLQLYCIVLYCIVS